MAVKQFQDVYSFRKTRSTCHKWKTDTTKLKGIGETDDPNEGVGEADGPNETDDPNKGVGETDDPNEGVGEADNPNEAYLTSLQHFRVVRSSNLTFEGYWHHIGALCEVFSFCCAGVVLSV